MELGKGIQDVLDIEKDFPIPKSIEIDNQKTAKTILIVEDNTDLRNYLAFILASDYTVLTAENGKKAIKILSKDKVPNLVISDLMMPLMDGYEFLTTFKNNEDWAEIPFIMLTARAAQQDKLKALRIITNLNNSLLSVEYLAELCKISRTTLYKKIKTVTDLSSNQYIKAIRLQLAKDFLEHKKHKTLQEVSNQVGFKNTTHFDNLFKQEYGKSPNDYFA